MPNRNSYLALNFPETARDVLRSVAVACSDAAIEQGYGFEAMDFDDLHMTFFFMGEALRVLTSGQLIAFHAAIERAVSSADLSPQFMRFESLDLFPPGKTNLIVAKFRPPSGLRLLQRQLVEIARQHGLGGSASLRKQLYEEDSWTPHCTLGVFECSRTSLILFQKLRAPAKQVANLGERVMATVSGEDSGLLEKGLLGTGIIMCGEV